MKIYEINEKLNSKEINIFQCQTFLNNSFKFTNGTSYQQQIRLLKFFVMVRVANIYMEI